jgi:hypothetical protein
LNELLKRLHAAFPDVTAEPPRDGGLWGQLSATRGTPVEEVEVRLTAAGVDSRFSMYALPSPTGDAIFEAATFDPADAASVVSASAELADAFGFWVEIVTLSHWGIEVWAERDQTPKQVAVAHKNTTSVKMHRHALGEWNEACRRATEAWCADAKALRPSSKSAMLKTYGGPGGITETLLRDLASFGSLTAWFELRTGASHENTALLRCPPWSVTVDFSGVPTGKFGF